MGALLPDAQRQREQWLMGLLVLVLAILYGALQNGYWIASNDGEFYLSIARNLATGRGYRWNGLPVVIVPPGWPLVLAVIIRVSPSFHLLNAVPMVFLIATAVIYYAVLRRLTTPFRAFVAVLVAATLFDWMRLTFIQFSDGLFCFLLAWALLLAWQINEGRPGRWRLPAMVLICVFMVTVRWAGVLAWLVVAAAAVSRDVRLRRRWLPVLLSGLFVGVAFVGLRWGLSLAGARANRSLPGQPRTRLESSAGRHYVILQKTAWSSYPRKLLAAGQWVSSLFWAAGQLAASSRVLALVVNAVGWVLILPFLMCLIESVRARQWIWVGVLLHCAALCTLWSPTPRYFVPVAPLLLLGMWRGTDLLSRMAASALWKRTCRAAFVLFLVSVIACNGGLYGVAVWVNRSKDFYTRYRAGQCKRLVAAAYYLNQRSCANRSVAVNASYINLNWSRRNTFGCRALNMLTGKEIRVVPSSVCSGKPNKRLVAWAQKERVRFYLYRPPVSPWRLWHFRVPWLQERMTGEEVVHNPFWILYELDGDGFVRIEPPPVLGWPRRLPGL